MPDTADRDIEAPAAPCRAICVAFDDFLHLLESNQFGLNGSPIRISEKMADFETRQLVEELFCALVFNLKITYP